MRAAAVEKRESRGRGQHQAIAVGRNVCDVIGDQTVAFVEHALQLAARVKQRQAVCRGHHHAIVASVGEDAVYAKQMFIFMVRHVFDGRAHDNHIEAAVKVADPEAAVRRKGERGDVCIGQQRTVAAQNRPPAGISIPPPQQAIAGDRGEAVFGAKERRCGGSILRHLIFLRGSRIAGANAMRHRLGLQIHTQDPFVDGSHGERFVIGGKRLRKIIFRQHARKTARFEFGYAQRRSRIDLRPAQHERRHLLVRQPLSGAENIRFTPVPMHHALILSANPKIARIASKGSDGEIGKRGVKLCKHAAAIAAALLTFVFAAINKDAPFARTQEHISGRKRQNRGEVAGRSVARQNLAEGTSVEAQQARAVRGDQQLRLQSSARSSDRQTAERRCRQFTAWPEAPPGSAVRIRLK